MNYEIVFYDEALFDLRDAVLWYNSELNGLGDNFEKEFYSSLELLAKGPKHYQIRYKDIRVFWMKRFPYGIHYCLDTNIIVISAVVYAGRNPDIWQLRINDED